MSNANERGFSDVRVSLAEHSKSLIVVLALDIRMSVAIDYAESQASCFSSLIHERELLRNRFPDKYRVPGIRRHVRLGVPRYDGRVEGADVEE